MMARLSSGFWIVVVLLLLGGAAYVIGKGSLEEPSVTAALVTALSAVILLVVQRDRENAREAARAHREQLAPLYEQLFEKFYKGVDFQDQTEVEFVERLQRKLVLYGASGVVLAWITWLRSMPGQEQNTDEADPSLLLRWEKVLLAIRKDLGHSNSDLEPGDLLRIYIYDVDKYVRPWLAASKGQ